jgi:hypothetical protein
MDTGGGSGNLRVGDWVEIKSIKEILTTLDRNECIDALPFMPEMLQYCGKKFQVFRSAHKTADTSELFTIRRMDDAVHLGDLRCDGSAHGGCQAKCLLFWKTSWLKPVPPDPTAIDKLEEGPDRGATESRQFAMERLMGAAKCSDEGVERYRCQATEMLKATKAVRRRERWNPLFYVRDITSGNVNLLDFVRFGSLAAVNAFLMQWFKFSIPRVRGRAGDTTPSRQLNLQPGEWVRVLPRREIELTLNSQRRNHGMWFDNEMLPFCGTGPFQVLGRVERIVHEKTGRSVKLRDPSIILKDVTCSGNRLHQRMFSPRHEFPFWKEIWLERVSGPH